MTVMFAPLFIASSVVDGLAMILTLFRLFFRLRIRRFWWEDMWAAIMVAGGTTYIIGQLISFESVNYETALIAGWITSLAFTSTVWAARMSILYSIIRVISPSSVLRKFTRLVAVVFFLFWATIIVLKTERCVKNTKPTFLFGRVRPVCALEEVQIFFEVINCVSDAALVNLSLKLLWRVKLPPRPRRMILCLFSSSAIMSMFSLFHAICQLLPLETSMYIAFEMELTSALIVCNLLVVVTYLYRVIFSSNGSLPCELGNVSEDDDFTTPIRTNISNELTTVDLSVTMGTSDGASSCLTSSTVPSSRCSSAA